MTVSAPLVTVVIPVYNGEKFIGDCLQSVINQTYSKIEILVVDDGSTDSTRERILPFGSCVSLISQNNSGVGAARNKGITLAKGNYISFLDADDLWMPHKLENQMAIFDAHSSVIAVGGNRLEIDLEGNVTNIIKSPFSGKPLNFHRILLTYGAVPGITTSSLVVQKAAIVKCGLFVEDRDFLSEDLDCWIRLSACGDFYIVPEVLHSYRITPGSLMRSDVLREYSSQVAILDKYKASITPRQYKCRMSKILADWADELIYLHSAEAKSKLSELFRQTWHNGKSYWLLVNYLAKRFLFREKFE